MDPRESRASIPRSRLAGGGEKPSTASLPACVRKSSRNRSNVGPASQVAASSGKATRGKKTKKSLQNVEMWGDRDPKESMETYCSRMTARFTEYDRCGKELKTARENLRLACNLANSGPKKKKPELRVKIQALKAEIEGLEERRKVLLEGAGLFAEKMQNEDNFAARKSPGKEEVDDGDSSGGEEEQSEAVGEAEVRGESMVVDDGAPAACVTPDPPLSEDHLAAAQMVALPVTSEESEDDGDGGVLRAIILQESPTHFQNFSFGDDLGPEGGRKKGKRRNKKAKVGEVTQFVFGPLQQSGPAEKSVQAAGPPILQDPTSEVERGQHGGYSAASKMAAGATGEANRPAGRDEQDGPRTAMAGGGGAEVRSEGQPSPLKVTSAETSLLAPAEEVKGAEKTLLKPAKLKFVPASSASAGSNTVNDTMNARSANDGCSSGMDGRMACVVSESSRGADGRSGSSGVDNKSDSGVNRSVSSADGRSSSRMDGRVACVVSGSSSGVDGRSGVDGKNGSGEDERSSSGVSRNVSSADGRSSSRMDGKSVGGVCGSVSSPSGDMGSGSGPAAPPVARSYASVAAGGSVGSLPPGSGDGQLQQRLLEALRRGERTLQVEGKEVDLSFWVDRHGLGAFRERNGETVWSLQTPGQEASRRNVARLVWKGKDACPQRGKVVELLFQMSFRARDIFALIHPFGSSEFDISFVRPEGLDLFWSNYELVKNEPGWRDFAVKAVSRQSMLKKVTVLTRNESLSCYDIMTWLGRYGEVTDVPRKNFDEHNIWSGAWTFSVRLRRSGNTVTHIPSAAFLGRDRIQIFYQGQPKLCHRCGGPNHFSANCNLQVCALCCGVGHLAATCRQIRCNLCGDLGHPFSRCPRSFSNAATTPAGESLTVAPVGEGTSGGEGAPEPVMERHKSPSELRRQERRRLERALENAQVAGVARGPTPDTGSEGQSNSEALGEIELDEEIRRLRREEGQNALSSGPSEYETVDEEEEGGQKVSGDQKKRRRSKGKRKAAPSSSSVKAPGHKRNTPVSDPLIVLSNRYEALGDTISPPPLEGEEEGQEAVRPPGCAEPSSSGAVSSGGEVTPDPGGKDPGMDMSQSLKRCKGSSSDSDGGGGKERKKV